MVRQCYKEINLRGKRLALVEKSNAVVTSYMGQGLRMTLRQLYYQLVTQNVVTNTVRSYKNLAKTISDARLAGLLDWDGIEDRDRVPAKASEWNDLNELASSAAYGYRLPRWKGQPTYAELWVEKRALAGVLEPLADEFHVVLMVNKGYSSQSAMRESALRFEEKKREYGAGECLLFYLGDFDPSGEDMVRDIRDRLEMFGVEDLEVRKIALTRAQIREHRPPPNPAKVTDPRAAKYIAEHGTSSWEVDALPPDRLQSIIRTHLEGVLDRPKYDAVLAREEQDKAEFRDVVARWMKRRKDPS